MNLVPGTKDGRHDEPIVLLNPMDAAESGVADGSEVTVTSAHGQLVGLVELDVGLRRGCVSIPHGFAAPMVNLLTSASADVKPLTGMPLYSGTPVALAPALPKP